ncbi:MAG TPA: pyrroloquinoline quinone-dependent dehydrogenase, partial [Vicinamibacterales bacterium]|nr:pyrroloquinoline quinone-dependent dehydrogenase [Vicinamibacterales bacterium]
RTTQVAVATMTAILLAATAGLHGQAGAKKGEWPTYGGDLGHTRYAPLDQITAANFSQLEVKWRFKTDNLGPRPEFNLESTPLMVNGRLYSTAGTRRSVIALDAATGELIWVHGENEGARGQAVPRQLSGRGLAYWTDGKEERILYVTPGYRLVALDAKTGNPVAEFGRSGIVDLKQDLDKQKLDLVNAPVGLHSTPIVGGNLVLVGAAFETGANPKSRANVRGAVRAYDVRTGALVWTFRTIPQAGEFGNETWENDSWAYSGNTGVWAQISVDEELGMAYLPVELPTHDYYGGARPGNTLFAESLVAVDLKTGVRKWHFQLVHHGIWDMDIPCAPILADIVVNGRPVKVVAQPSKQGFLYVFDRVTGQPIWPIEERPVPKGDAPGEKYSPTQPFPTRPLAYERQGLAVDDLIDFTPELRAEALKLIEKYRIGPVFTPPAVSKAEGPIATLAMSTQAPATNWPGGSFDPETHVLYVHSNAQVAQLGLVPPPPGAAPDVLYHQGTVLSGARRTGGSGSATTNAQGGNINGIDVRGLPIVKPPYGRINAINLDTGDIVWQVAHGETPDVVKNHPALKGLTIPRTGRNGAIGTLVTKTLVIAGEPGFGITPSGARGSMLRAYDKRTGAETGAVYMPAPQSGSPMTYMLNGKQYLVVAISGGNYSGELVAFALPN